MGDVAFWRAVREVAALAGPIVGFIVGTWVTSWHADRDRQIRLRGIARTLLLDMRRIRRELGPRGSQGLLAEHLGLAFAAPRVHPWVESVVADVAVYDVAIVEQFMQLQRHLANLSASMAHVRQRDRDLEQARELDEISALSARNRALNTPAWQDKDFGNPAEASAGARKGLQRVQEARSVALQEFRDALAGGHDSLDALEVQLQAIVDSPAPGRLPWAPADADAALPQWTQ